MRGFSCQLMFTLTLIFLCEYLNLIKIHSDCCTTWYTLQAEHLIVVFYLIILIGYICIAHKSSLYKSSLHLRKIMIGEPC